MVKNGKPTFMIISRANKERYRDLKTEPLNDFAKWVDNWPTSVDEAIQLLNTFHIEKQPWGVQKTQAEMAIAQATGGNQARENGNRGRSINHSTICTRSSSTRSSTTSSRMLLFHNKSTCMKNNF